MSLRRSILITVLVTTLILFIRSGHVNGLVGPSLKPLTPIAGSNLFLNTVYKWYDRTKPGCYATWFMDKYHDYHDKYRGVSMVCNKSDQQWFNTTDADWIFEPTGGKETSAAYGGTVRIRNVGANDHLETWLSAGTWYVGVASYAGNPAEDMWNVRSDASNKNNLQLEIQDWYLAQMPAPNHRSYIFLKRGETAGYPYSFVPTLDLVGKMYDFEFVTPPEEELAKHTSQKGLIDSYIINNDSPGTISRKVTVSEKIINEFSWGFSESLKIFSKIRGSAGIPLVAEISVEAGFDIDVGANQNWKTSNEKLIEMSYDVSVPANSQVTISASYDLIKGLSLAYTARIEITAKTKRLSAFNDIVNGAPVTGQMIRNHLDYSNFDGKFIAVQDDRVIAEVTGTMIASVGIRGRLNVNGASVYSV